MKKIFFLAIGLLIIQSFVLAEDVLTLDEFVKSSIKNHPSYKVSAKEYLVAIQSNESAKSLEDWNLIASAVWVESYPAPVSSFSSSYQKTMGYTVGAEKYFAGSGTALKIEHSNTRIQSEYSTPSSFNPPSSYYLSNLSLTISQPLLRNAFGLAAKNALKMSDHSLKLAEIKLAEDWEEFIAMLREEYLVWQQNHKNINLIKDKVKTVEEQLALVQKQVKVGLSEELDLVQIKQKLQAYKIMLEQAKMAFECQNKKIVALSGSDIYNNVKPEELIKNGPVMAEDSAIEYLEQSSNVKKTSDLLVSLQKTILETRSNEKLPDLNLVLQAKPNAFTQSASDSLARIGNYNEYTLSISSSRPFANQKAEAEAQKAEEGYQKALNEQENIILNAKIGLCSLYTTLQYLTNTLALSENNLKLAKERLVLEKKKFNQGRSSVFFVLQAEDDLLAAENSLNQTLFAREKVINQIKSFTDRYYAQYF